MATLVGIIRPKKVEPDGKRCYVCDDVIYLTQWALYFGFEEGKWKKRLDFDFCDSCKEIIMEKD